MLFTRIMKDAVDCYCCVLERYMLLFYLYSIVDINSKFLLRCSRFTTNHQDSAIVASLMVFVHNRPTEN